MLLAATATFERLLTYVVFAGWIFFALGALSIFWYRRANGVPSTYRVPGYPVTPVLFVAAAAAIVINTVFTQPKQAAVGIALVLIGIPAFLFWQSRKQAMEAPGD